MDMKNIDFDEQLEKLGKVPRSARYGAVAAILAAVISSGVGQRTRGPARRPRANSQYTQSKEQARQPARVRFTPSDRRRRREVTGP